MSSTKVFKKSDGSFWVSDLKELALRVTTDPDHKFDLSLQLDDLDAALEIVREIPETEAETKWKAVGDRALAVWRFDLAQECYQKAGDLNAQMLILLSIGDRAGLTKLASQAGKNVLPPGQCVFLLLKSTTCV